jgi:hypothetical protein
MAVVTVTKAVDWGATGKVGTLGYRVESAGGTVRIAFTTAGVRAGGTLGTNYAVDVAYDNAWGPCTIYWADGTDEAADDLTVAADIIAVEGETPVSIVTAPRTTSFTQRNVVINDN